MILIKNLTKKYRSKNRRVCLALNRVNLALPDTGMVFIIGKSGSGKSTLLNMIGGLDSFDGGAIIADGNDLSTFKPKDFYKYRASYTGFIFQDYHLIEELSIKDNVSLALELEGEAPKDVSPALAAVDLAGYGDRYPDELSGGQKQRVAIARAIIKSPRVILCDEPTGNLDKNTSTQILDLLKEISKERLVLIVSHNMPDAEKYGDRIIELADGKVINDITRKAGYENKFSLANGVLTLPYNRNLTAEEVRLLNQESQKGTIKLYRQNDGGYEKTNQNYTAGSRVRLKASKMKAKTTNKLFAAFTKRGTVRSVTTAFISAMMLVLLIIFQSFLSFDGGKVISNSLADQGTSTLVLKKNAYYDEYGNMTKNLIYPVNNEDLETIDEISGAKKHLLYSYSIRVSHTDPTTFVEKEYDPPYSFDSSSIFTAQMAGTLVCDMEYLTNKFGIDGELKILAGSLEQATNSYGVIITDYLADAMIYYNPTLYRNYDQIIGPVYLNELLYGHVSSIIDTGYKTRYKEIIEEVAENKNKGQAGLKTIDEMEAMKIIDDIKCNLSIGYSLNPNFTTAILSTDARNFISLGEVSWTNSATNSTGKATANAACRYDPNANLKKGEIVISESWLSNIFLDKKAEFPFSVELKRYEFPENAGRLMVNTSLTVVGAKNYSTPGFSIHYLISEEDLIEFKKNDIVPYAVYLENYENADVLINEMSKKYFSWNSTNGTAVTLLNQSVNMFYELFSLFEILLVILIVVFLASYSIRSIKSNYYQIGVIKAIGGRSSDISKIYTAQTALLTILVCILTYIGAFYLVDVANDVLIASFVKITSTAIGSINIIEFDPKIVILTIAISFVLSILSTIAPLLALHRIKPINIIKAKE